MFLNSSFFLLPACTPHDFFCCVQVPSPLYRGVSTDTILTSQVFDKYPFLLHNLSLVNVVTGRGINPLSASSSFFD